MRLLDWLTAERVTVPVSGGSLEEVLAELARGLPSSLLSGEDGRRKFARDVAFGSRGEVLRLHSLMVGVVVEQEGLTRPLAFLGISPSGFRVTAEGKETPGEAQALLLILVPGRSSSFRARVVPELRRFFSDEVRVGALLEADTPEEVLAVPGLAALEFPEHATVAEALDPVQYRVYPETPVEELVGLMIRRELHAVPVVGEGYEVLGIVTTGDLLRHLLARSRKEEEREGTARDVMTRTVLCVSEDQELREVSQLMVNRDVEQLPVVRDGQLVGFITRDTALASLFAGAAAAAGNDRSTSK